MALGGNTPNAIGVVDMTTQHIPFIVQNGSGRFFPTQLTYNSGYKRMVLLAVAMFSPLPKGGGDPGNAGPRRPPKRHDA